MIFLYSLFRWLLALVSRRNRISLQGCVTRVSSGDSTQCFSLYYKIVRIRRRWRSWERSQFCDPYGRWLWCRVRGSICLGRILYFRESSAPEDHPLRSPIYVTSRARPLRHRFTYTTGALSCIHIRICVILRAEGWKDLLGVVVYYSSVLALPPAKNYASSPYPIPFSLFL